MTDILIIMKIKPIHIFIPLTVCYLVYSFFLYRPSFSSKKVKEYKNELAINGRLIFQKYNCQDCHQLYGLGGYLGPDLTNVYDKYNGNNEALKAFFKGGMKQMPEFNLRSYEEKELIEFFKMTNASGSADPRDYDWFPSGMIEQK